jgi:NADH:ubiquinone reductase (H+-translocating)
MKRGVDIRLNTRLVGATEETALLADGDRIMTRTLVSTVPSGPNPVVAGLPLKAERGRIVVDASLEVPEHFGVWALGDCAAVRDARTGEICPPTAQHATRQAECVARNIAATLRGEPRRSFAFTALGKMGSLGRRSAVAEIFGVKLSGFLAWWIWRTIYLLKLPGFDRKLRVATDWTLDLLLPPDIVQLKTDRALGVRREYFEPGQAVFQEGDRGDRLYVITDGEVEVLKRDGGGAATPLRRLGVGECFGEIALVSDRPRTATVRAIVPTNVLAVDRDAFQALFATLPPLRGFVETLIAARDR